MESSLLERGQEVSTYINAVFEASIFLNPASPGLSLKEALEAARRGGYQEGESLKEISQIVPDFLNSSDRRLVPTSKVFAAWGNFNVPQNPDFRNVLAFEFLHWELRKLDWELKGYGSLDESSASGVSRNVLVGRAVSKDLPKLDVEAAITLWVVGGYIIEHDGLLRYANGRSSDISPGEKLRAGDGLEFRDEIRVRAHAIIASLVSGYICLEN
jgi:hypothetical protein